MAGMDGRRNQHKNMCAVMSSMRKAKLMTDMTIVCDGMEFHVHLAYVCAGIPYFYKLYVEESDDCITVDDSSCMKQHITHELEGITTKGLQAVLDFVYADVEVAMAGPAADLDDVTDFRDFLHAAVYLQVDPMVDSLWRSLPEVLYRDSYFELWQLATYYKRVDIMEQLSSKIKYGSENETFLNFDESQVTCLLGFLTGAKNKDLYELVLSWTKFDWKNRKCQLKRLLDDVGIKGLPATIALHLARNKSPVRRNSDLVSYDDPEEAEESDETTETEDSDDEISSVANHLSQMNCGEEAAEENELPFEPPEESETPSEPLTCEEVPGEEAKGDVINSYMDSYGEPECEEPDTDHTVYPQLYFFGLNPDNKPIMTIFDVGTRQFLSPPKLINIPLFNWQMCVVRFERYLYFMGGFDEQRLRNIFRYSLDDHDDIVMVSVLRKDITLAGASVVDNRIVIAGGADYGTGEVGSKIVQVYEPSINQCSQISDTNYRYVAPLVFARGSTIHVCGWNESDFVSIERYDTKMDQWSVLCRSQTFLATSLYSTYHVTSDKKSLLILLCHDKRCSVRDFNPKLSVWGDEFGHKEGCDMFGLWSLGDLGMCTLELDEDSYKLLMWADQWIEVGCIPIVNPYLGLTVLVK